MNVDKARLLALLLEESIRGKEWGPLTEKGANDIINRLEKEEEVSENWCREGCCKTGWAGPEQNIVQKAVAYPDYPESTPIRPIDDNLNQLAKNLERLGMNLETLRNRLEPVSQQITAKAPGMVDAPLNGSSDVSARLFNYSCRVYAFECFVEELIRDLEI